MNANWLLRLARKVAATVAEMNDASRRLAVLRSAPDRYVFDANEPPATYTEFLARTAGQLLHEPPAARRVQRGLPR